LLDPVSLLEGRNASAMHLRLAREIYREYQRQLWKPTASEVPAEFGERIKGDETSFTVLPSKGGQLGR